MSPEQIQQFASQCKHTVHAHGPVAFPDLAEFAALVEQHIRADEREQCAKVCDGNPFWLNAAHEIRTRKP